jgi:PPP family 3-phenylpropionic acid transporter
MRSGIDAAPRDAGVVDVKVLFALTGAVGAFFLPFYALLLSERGLSPGRIGVMLSVCGLVGVVAGPIWSHLADATLGSVRTLRVASQATVISTLLLIPAGGRFPAVFAGATALAVSQAPSIPLTDSIALSRLGERAHEYGSVRLWASVAWALCIVVAGLVFEETGLDPIVPLYAIGIAGVAVFLGRFPDARPTARPRTDRLGSVGTAFRTVPQLTTLLVGILLVWMALAASWTFGPLAIAGGGGGPFLIGLAGGLTAAIEVPFMRGFGRLGSRFGVRTLFAAGCTIHAAMLVSWAIFDGAVAMTAARAAGGAGFALIYVACVVVVGRLFPSELQSTGQALRFATGGVGAAAGSVVGGALYGPFGPGAVFVVAAVAVATGVAVAWSVLGASDATRVDR